VADDFSGLKATITQTFDALVAYKGAGYNNENAMKLVQGVHRDLSAEGHGKRPDGNLMQAIENQENYKLHWPRGPGRAQLFPRAANGACSWPA